MNQLLQRGAELIASGIFGGGIVVLILKSFLTNYMAEKAKNLATREDFDRLLERNR